MANRSFRAIFGALESILTIVWERIRNKIQNARCHKNFLWALKFVKTFSIEHNSCGMFKCDKKTFRKRAWVVIYIITELDYVSISKLIQVYNHTTIVTILLWSKIDWTGRLEERPIIIDGKNVYVSVDGTDYPINESHPFMQGWYSHKIYGPRLRYEVRLSVSSGKLIWVDGPFQCGTHHDSKIFQTDMKSAVQNAFVIADRGYTDTKSINTMSSPNGATIHRTMRARHETVNARRKKFNRVWNIFRHDISKHGACVHCSCCG